MQKVRQVCQATVTVPNSYSSVKSDKEILQRKKVRVLAYPVSSFKNHDEIHNPVKFLIDFILP